MTASSNAITFASYEIAKEFVLRDGTGEFRVQALVPHSEVRLELDGRPSPGPSGRSTSTRPTWCATAP